MSVDQQFMVKVKIHTSTCVLRWIEGTYFCNISFNESTLNNKEWHQFINMSASGFFMLCNNATVFISNQSTCLRKHFVTKMVCVRCFDACVNLFNVYWCSYISYAWKHRCYNDFGAILILLYLISWYLCFQGFSIHPCYVYVWT